MEPDLITEDLSNPNNIKLLAAKRANLYFDVFILNMQFHMCEKKITRKDLVKFGIPLITQWSLINRKFNPKLHTMSLIATALNVPLADMFSAETLPDGILKTALRKYHNQMVPSEMVYVQGFLPGRVAFKIHKYLKKMTHK